MMKKGDTTYLLIMGAVILIGLVILSTFVIGTEKGTSEDKGARAVDVARGIKIIIMDLSSIKEAVIYHPVPHEDFEIHLVDSELPSEPKKVVVVWEDAEITEEFYSNIPVEGSVSGTNTVCIVKKDYEGLVKIKIFNGDDEVQCTLD